MAVNESQSLAEGAKTSINDFFTTSASLFDVAPPSLKEINIACLEIVQNQERMRPVMTPEDVRPNSFLFIDMVLEIEGKTVSGHSKLYVKENCDMTLSGLDVDEIEIEPEDVEDDKVTDEYKKRVAEVANALTLLVTRALTVQMKKS